MKSKTTAPYKTFLVLCRAHLITGKYQEFNLLINSYFDGDYKNERELKSKINNLLPVIQALVIKSNCLKLMSMAPPPAIGGVVIQNFNPLDMIFTDFWGRSIIPEISDMIEQSIGKYENDMVDFKEVKNQQVKKICNVEYTDKITYKWLRDYVPLKIWIAFFGLLISSFVLGYEVSNQMNSYLIKTKEINLK